MSEAYGRLHVRSLPKGDAPLEDRVDAHFEAVGLGTSDCHGMMRHVLDCLGALRVQSKLDDKMNGASRKLFRSTCLQFLDSLVAEQDEGYDDGSAIHHLMNAFPDEQKRRDGRGWLPLHWAACTEDFAEEDMKTVARERPIMAKSGHGPNAENSLNMTTSGLLPFHFICSFKQSRLINVKNVLALYPDAIKTPDPNGWLPLHWASWNCMDQDVIRFLLDAYLPAVYEPTARGQLPFLLSLHNRRVQTLDEILEPNPDALDACDFKGNTAVHYAAEHCNPEGAHRCIQLNPNLPSVKNFHDELPAHYAFGWINRDDKRGRWRQLEMIKIILAQNPETCSQADKDGNLPLHLAVAYNAAYEVIEAIYHIYPTAALLPDGDGNLPAHYCDKDNTRVQELLFHTSKPLAKLGLTSSFATMTGITGAGDSPFDNPYK